MDEYISLRKAAQLAGYRNTGILRQAILRGTLKGERRSTELGVEYHVTTPRWLLEYVAQRPQFRNNRLAETRERIEAEYGEPILA